MHSQACLRLHVVSTPRHACGWRATACFGYMDIIPGGTMNRRTSPSCASPEHTPCYGMTCDQAAQVGLLSHSLIHEGCGSLHDNDNAGILGLLAGGAVRMVGRVRAYRQGCQEEELRLSFLAGL